MSDKLIMYETGQFALLDERVRIFISILMYELGC